MAALARFSLTCLAALCLAGTAHAASQALPANQTVTQLTQDQRQLKVEQLRQQVRQAVAFQQAERPRPAGRASVSLQPMFSAQAGSWPFEPFVNNGLFRAIAGYQAHHPQVVQLRGGSITLAQLHDALTTRASSSATRTATCSATRC